MIPIELISHLARPASLALRLRGNMAADHKVVFTFFTLVPILVPVPFKVLGDSLPAEPGERDPVLLRKSLKFGVFAVRDPDGYPL